MELFDRNLKQKSGKCARNFNEKEEHTPKGVRESLLLERVRAGREKEREVFKRCCTREDAEGSPYG
jgi:hypothetical protein